MCPGGGMMSTTKIIGMGHESWMVGEH